MRESIERVRRIADRLPAVSGGEAEDNGVFPPASSRDLRRVSKACPDGLEPLLGLYALCDGFCLSDLHVGYFVHRASKTASQRQELNHVITAGGDSFGVVMFGSDGGGGLFVLRADEGEEVLWLPPARVTGGCWRGGHEHVPAVVADDLPGFLARVCADGEAFVDGRQPWKYMI